MLSTVRWDTDYPYASRTGPEEVVAGAEHVFAADSQAALAELAWASARGPGEQVLTVASICDLAVSFTGTTDAGTRWITASLTSPGSGPRPARMLRDDVVRLACPSAGFAALASMPGSEPVTAAWTARRASVTRYAAQIRSHQHNADTALLTLVRGHHERMTGPDHDSEQITMRLARSAALGALAQARPPA